LIVLTVFDVAVAWLTWREYRQQRRRRRTAASITGPTYSSG
jgi:uncharacterized membrane protein